MKNFFSNFKGDALGGITAGIVALPLALAFGLGSGLGPDAGLYGAIFIAFFAALFGGTPTQISGPTAPMTALSMIVISGIVASYNGDIEAALPSILAVFLMAGLFLIVLGAIKLGQYIKFIPYPVVSGFMSAIGLIIIITQILPMLGYYPNEDIDVISKFIPQAEDKILESILREEADGGTLVLEDFTKTINRAHEVTDELIMVEARTLAKNNASGVIGALKYMGKAFSNIQWIELLLALITIFIIYGFKRITSKIPSTLIALLLVSGVAYILKINGLINYRPIPEIPSGFPSFQFRIFTEFSWSQVSPYFFTALTLAFLGAIDSLLTSVVADNMTKTMHKPDKELVGQGIGNSVAALFGGIPGAGATIRTVVNIQAGGKTKLSGMIAGVLLLFVLLALGPIASQIPAAVLAGILLTVGIGVMDYKGLKSLPIMNRSEIIIMLTVLVLAVVWNLVYAVGIGLLIAALVFMKKMGDLTSDESGMVGLDDIDLLNNDSIDPALNLEGLPDKLKEEVFIKHVGGPLFFGYTKDFRKLSQELPSTASHLVIKMEKMNYVDQSGLFTLESVLFGLVKNDVQVILLGLQDQPRIRMEAIDIIPDLIPEEQIFENLHDCIGYIKAKVKDVY